MVQPFELLGSKTGSCLRVAVALEVLGLPYKATPVDLRGAEHRDAAFLAINPDGRVPVLVDHSQPESLLIVTQSNAILLHLSDLRPGVLLPAKAGPNRLVAVGRFIYFVTDGIAPNGSGFFLQRQRQSEGAQCLMQRSLEAIVASERFLDGARYMAGDSFSLADIAALTVIRASSDRLDCESLSRLQAWFEAVVTRPDVHRGLAAFSSLGPKM